MRPNNEYSDGDAQVIMFKLGYIIHKYTNLPMASTMKEITQQLTHIGIVVAIGEGFNTIDKKMNDFLISKNDPAAVKDTDDDDAYSRAMGII